MAGCAGWSKRDMSIRLLESRLLYERVVRKDGMSSKHDVLVLYAPFHPVGRILEVYDAKNV